jgi:hypothetical protein
MCAVTSTIGTLELKRARKRISPLAMRVYARCRANEHVFTQLRFHSADNGYRHRYPRRSRLERAISSDATPSQASLRLLAKSQLPESQHGRATILLYVSHMYNVNIYIYIYIYLFIYLYLSLSIHTNVLHRTGMECSRDTAVVTRDIDCFSAMILGTSRLLSAPDPLG